MPEYHAWEIADFEIIQEDTVGVTARPGAHGCSRVDFANAVATSKPAFLAGRRRC